MGVLDFLSGLANTIVGAIENFFETIGKALKIIVVGIINFVKQVVNYFRGLKLNQHEDVPFIVDNSKLKNMIHNAPVKKVGIFEGVYNENEDCITEGRVINANDLDEKTEDILDAAKPDNPIVVLN